MAENLTVNLQVDGRVLAEAVTRAVLRKAARGPTSLVGGALTTGERKTMSGKETNDLPDSAFAYIEDGGKKDTDDKTVPRSLRHYPVHDKAHAQNAYARASAQIKNDGSGKSIAQKAMPKIKAALKKFGVDVSEDRASCPSCGSGSPARDVDGEMRCPECDAYRGDTGTKGDNVNDGTYSGGSVTPSGVQDGTGTVSSDQDNETRDGCSCGAQTGLRFDSIDDLVKALTDHVEQQQEADRSNSNGIGIDGVDGSDGVNAGFGDADTKPHPSADDDEGNEGADQREDPTVDDGDSIDSDADDAANKVGGDTDAGGDGDDGSEPANEDFGDADTPPHPENDDTQGSPQREDPNVDEGENSVEDGVPYPDPQADEPERKSGRRHKTRRTSTPAPKPEHRIRTSSIEVRSGGSSDVLEGTAIQYLTPYTVYDAFGAFTERMDPGVCNSVLARGDLDCRFLINHDGLPLGRTTSGTLELNNTPEGLDTVTHLSENSTLAADLADAVSRRDVTQMSVGFRVAEDEWNEDYSERTVFRFADLLDVSAVTYPASPTTSIDVAKRMLYALPLEARVGVAQAYNIVCDVRAGSRLDDECSGWVLRALETLYGVDDPRVPLVRVREAWKIARDVRAGKQLSASNAGFIAAALESLHRADDVDIPSIVRSLGDVDQALDSAQEALSQVSGLPNPDDDEDDQDPGEKMKRRELELERSAERRRRAAKAQRDRLVIRTRPRKSR